MALLHWTGPHRYPHRTSQPQSTNDQQHRDALLVRQTTALEKIAHKTSSTQTHIAWAFWLTVGAVVLWVLLVASAAGRMF
ncbi:hypothetical protein ASG41_05840 [Modestobacter sp. Leaf380]|nr:hypothetical protein ASG41_05840 [Modestobacter sp. Leaf380]